MSVDEQLQSICRHFDPIVYESIILSYSLLDRHFAKQQQNKNNKEEEEEETEETTFEVVIPEGVKPGQRFTVLFPEGRRTVECPENKRVGDKIRVGADPTSDCGALSALAQQIQTHFTQAVMRCTKSVVAGMVFFSLYFPYIHINSLNHSLTHSTYTGKRCKTRCKLSRTLQINSTK